MLSQALNSRLIKVAEVALKLHAPARYELSELLNELKSGRPAAEQQWLDQKISELNFNQLPGGLAEGRSPEDFPADQLLKGTEVEAKEHGDSSIGTEIAMDHLTENDRYYDLLEQLEEQWRKAGLDNSARQASKQVSRKAVDTAFVIIRRNALALIHAEKVLDSKYQQAALKFIEVNLKSLKEWGAYWDKLTPYGVDRIQDSTAIDAFLAKNYDNFVSYLKNCKQNLEYYVQHGNPKSTAWSNALKNCEQALQTLGE